MLYLLIIIKVSYFVMNWGIKIIKTIDLLNTINSDIVLSVAKENTPIYVKTEAEKLTFEYLIAPLEIKSEGKK